MGFYIRKQKRLGLVNLNLSKSGLGVSTGVTGARLVFSPNGTYVHLGRHGLYYRKKLSKIKKDSFPNDKNNDSFSSFSVSSKNNIETINFDSLTDIDSLDFVNELEKKDNKTSFYNIVIIAFFVGLFSILALTFLPINEVKFVSIATINSNSVNLRKAPSIESEIVYKAKIGDKFVILNTSNDWIEISVNNSSNAYVYSSLINISEEKHSIPTNFYEQKKTLISALFIIYIVMSTIAIIWSKKLDKKRKTIELYYDLDDEMNEKYNQFIKAFQGFSNVSKVWQIKNAQTGHDKKYNAGAETLVKRVVVNDIFLHYPPMKYLMTNVYVPFIGLNNIKLYFFPERLLLKQNNKYAAISYENLYIQPRSSLFREYDKVPRDASVVDYAWQYMNKNGGPDKRFSNNKKIPICSYSNYCFQTTNGFNEVISTSKTGGMDDFILAINKLVHKQNVEDNYQSKQIENEDIYTGSMKTHNDIKKFIESINQKNNIKESGSETTERLFERFLKKGEVVSTSDLVKFLKCNKEDADTLIDMLESFNNQLLEEIEMSKSIANLLYSKDVLFEEAARIVVLKKEASPSFLQQQLQIGFSRSNRLMEELEDAGIVSPLNKNNSRNVLFSDTLSLDEYLKSIT